MSDGPLDAIAVLVDGRVEVTFSVHSGALRDDWAGADRLGMIEDGVAVISAIGDEVGGSQAGDQREGIGAVTGLAAGEEEADRPAKGVDGDVPLAGQSSSGTPRAWSLTPLFGRWRPGHGL